MILGTIAPAGVSTFNLTHVPEFLYVENVITPLDSLRCNIFGQGLLVDLNTAGILAFNALRCVGFHPNSVLIALANGAHRNTRCDIVISNPAAAALTLHGFSQREGTVFFQSLRQTIFANSGAVFTDFAALGIELPTTDEVDITYQDGLVQRMTDEELRGMLSTTQQNIPTASAVIDNVAARIRSVSIVPPANRTVFVKRYVEPGNLTPVVLQ